MKAKCWVLLWVLTVLSGCGEVEHIDIETLKFAEVSYSVEGVRLVIDSNHIFENDKKTLKNQAVKVLRSLYTQVSGEYFSHVLIKAHSDDALTERSAMDVTEYQAQVIAGYLWFRGIDAGEIDAVGEGFSEPVADTVSVNGARANQRIEIFLT